MVLRGFARGCGDCGSALEEISFLVVLVESGDGAGAGANLPRSYELPRKERFLRVAHRTCRHTVIMFFPARLCVYILSMSDLLQA